MKRKKKDEFVQIDPSLSEFLEKSREEGERLERIRIVAYLRWTANAPHPTEAGERLLSPAARGLVWLMADHIESGDYMKVEEE